MLGVRSVYLSVYVSIYEPNINRSIDLSIYLSIDLPICLYDCLSIHPSIQASIYQDNHTFLPTYLSSCLPINLPPPPLHRTAPFFRISRRPVQAAMHITYTLAWTLDLCTPRRTKTHEPI